MTAFLRHRLWPAIALLLTLTIVTGFIYPLVVTGIAQGLHVRVRLPEGGPQVAVVVLGAKSNAGRFWETRHLFNWLSAKASDLMGGVPAAQEAPAAAN